MLPCVVARETVVGVRRLPVRALRPKRYEVRYRDGGAASCSFSQLRRLAVFAQWRDEAALERFLARDPLGRALAGGWHVRLEFLRRWSTLAVLPKLPVRAGAWDQDESVVAVTLARMRLLEVPRFLRHGKPVERLVRDHPGVTLAMAGDDRRRARSDRRRTRRCRCAVASTVDSTGTGRSAMPTNGRKVRAGSTSHDCSSARHGATSGGVAPDDVG